jgi:hypothetical protein
VNQQTAEKADHVPTPMEEALATAQACSIVASCVSGVSDVVPWPTVKTRTRAYRGSFAFLISSELLNAEDTVYCMFDCPPQRYTSAGGGN